MKSLLAFALVIIGFTIKAVALVFGWAWFVEPMGAPPIGFVQALGLSTLTSAFIGLNQLKRKGESINTFDEFLDNCGQSVIYFCVVFAFMYLFSWFV